MAIDCIEEVPGAAELSNWFGGFPSFHDAYMALQINQDGTGRLRAYAWRMTSKIDAEGYVVSDKHFACTFEFEDMRRVSMAEFMPGLAILGQLDINKTDDGFEVDFTDTAYGLSGSLVCKKMKLTFEPGVRKP
jgi:hypothetical protein